MMKMLGASGLVVLTTLLVSAGALSSYSATGESTAATPRANKYIGAKKCKSCHKADEKGNQFAVWENGPHARAFETLGTDAAKEHAAARGIEDPQKAPECLKCHTTAFGVDESLIKKGFKPEGVQCESCHGPGEAHQKARMAAAMKKEDGPPAPGEIVVDVTQETCLQCHNEESPTFTPFCFFERLERIRHARPDSTREVLVCGCGECGCDKGCPDDGCGVPKK